MAAMTEEAGGVPGRMIAVNRSESTVAVKVERSAALKGARDTIRVARLSVTAR
jgi:hypothetical protein